MKTHLLNIIESYQDNKTDEVYLRAYKLYLLLTSNDRVFFATPCWNDEGIDTRMLIRGLTPKEICLKWKNMRLDEYNFLFLLMTMPFRDTDLWRRTSELAQKYCFTGPFKARWTRCFKEQGDDFLSELLQEFFVVRKDHNRQLVAELCNLTSFIDGLEVREKEPNNYGLFAVSNIKGPGITFYGGLFSNEDSNMSYKTFRDVRQYGSCYIIQVYLERYFIDSAIFWKLKEKGRFCNHSLNAQAGMQDPDQDDITTQMETTGRLSISVSLLKKDMTLKPGDEVFVNYTLEYNSACMPDDWTKSKENKEHFIERYTEVF